MGNFFRVDGPHGERECMLCYSVEVLRGGFCFRSRRGRGGRGASACARASASASAIRFGFCCVLPSEVFRSGGWDFVDSLWGSLPSLLPLLFAATGPALS